MSYASAGTGSPHHLFMELLLTVSGIEMTHVPYRGTIPALTDVLAGQLPIMFCDLISGLDAMRTGKVRPVFTGARNRLSVLPDVPSSRGRRLSRALVQEPRYHQYSVRTKRNTLLNSEEPSEQEPQSMRA